MITRMAIINISTNNKRWQRCAAKGTLMLCWWEYRLVKLLWKAVQSYLKKLKKELLYDPVILLLRISEKPETLIQKNISTPTFIAVLFTIAKIWKQPKCPSVDEWIQQLQDIYTMEYYSAVKKKKNFTLCDGMDGPGEHYAK